MARSINRSRARLARVRRWVSTQIMGTPRSRIASSPSVLIRRNGVSTSEARTCTFLMG